MAKISNKQKEAISNIYLMTVVCTDIHYKLSFLTQLYAAIRSALLTENIIEVKTETKKVYSKKKQDFIEKQYETIISTKADKIESAKLLTESKDKLYEAYTAFAERNLWIRADQIIIEIIERLSTLGYMHDLIDIETERWNASYSMIAPTGNAGGDNDD
jgi:hypothetical protein